MKHETIRLLLVNGRPADARLIRTGLGAANLRSIEIARVAGLEEARARLAVAEPDVVLLDLNLPDSQGLATLHSLLEAAPNVPVIVLTRRDDEQLALEALQAGAEDFLAERELAGGALLRSVRFAISRKRKQRREQLLAQTAQVLAATLDSETALRTVAHLIVPTLADWCIIELIEESSGEVQVVEIVAAEPAREAVLRAKLSSYPHDPIHGSHPIDEALRSGESCLLTTVDDGVLERAARDARHLRLLREAAATSMLIVPLRTGGQVLGVLVLAAAESGRVFGPADLELVEELAGHAAVAVDHARLYREAQEAQQRAEEAAERTRRMETVTAALAAALTPEQVAHVAMREGLVAVQATAGALLVLDDARTSLNLLEAAGLADEILARWQSFSLALASPLADAIRLRRPVAVPDCATLRARFPDFDRALGSVCMGAMIALPLVVEDAVLGVIVLTFPAPRVFAPEAEALLLRSAEKCARALERAFRYQNEQRAHAAAERATQLRDEVLGIVAHDLRNPLSAISTYASLMLDAPVTDQRLHSSLQSILSSARQMDKLIGDLLDVSLLEADRLEVEVYPTQPDLLVREAVSTLEPIAAERSLALQCEVSDGLPPVYADRDRVLQVLSNLLGNALKFTPAGGTVTVQAKALGEEVLFLVTDTGVGIAAEHLPQLFDRFWQARHTRRGGAGLGLAIAKGIVERHGGRLGVESRPGVGSTFFFTLPAASLAEETGTPAPPGSEADEEVIEAVSSPVRPARILLVDDHPVVRRGLREQLRRAPGLEVVGEASTGEEALRMAELARPDLVLMDLKMPGIGGIEAIRRLTRKHPQVSALALTAEAEAETLLPVLEAGGSGFVRKTAAHEDLLVAIETVLRGEVFLYPSGNRLLLREFRLTADSVSDHGLTENERRVVALAAEGYTSPEIGKRLFLSSKTVDTYRSRAMRKLGIDSRPELVRFAVQKGLLKAN
jgi:DNA-binding NarL/FixJ family response regulator/signal transduction histidine kinase